MFIIVFLLTLLSIPRVLLKPTVVESEFDDTLLDDDTRSKRQAQFFELLHQAIEKYANCANEHLAPLRTLANYKQYETFVYPEGNSQSSQSLVAATNNQKKPKIKCTKVNLCSIQQPQAQSNPKYNLKTPLMLGRSQEPNSDISQQNGRHFSYNPKNYGRLPLYSNNRTRNIPTSYKPRYSYGSGNKNFTSYPLNQSFLNKLLYGPTLANRKGIVITPTQNPKGGMILGSVKANKKPSGEFKSCGCTKSSTEKPSTTIESLKQETFVNSDNKEGLEKSSTTTKTTVEPILGSTQTNSTPPAKPKSCGCLKKTTTKPQTQSILNLTSTESDLLGSSNENATSLNRILNSSTQKLVTDKLAFIGPKDSNSNQNLNLLFLQLDIMAHNESKEDLKQILQKLNALKLALKITEPTETSFSSSTSSKSTSSTPIITKSSTTSTTTTHKVPEPLKDSITTTAKVEESPLVAATEVVSATTQNPSLLTTKTFEILTTTQTATEEPEIVTKIPEVLTKNNHSDIIKTLNDAANLQLGYANDFNNTNQTQTISKTDNSTIITHSMHTAQKSENNSSPLLKSIQHFSHNLNLNESNDITAVTSSPPLQLNFTNSQDLARISKEMHTLVDSMTNKTSQVISQQHHNTSGHSNAMNITIVRKTIASTNNKTSNGNFTSPEMNFSKNHSQNINLLVTNVNGSIVPRTLNHTNNGSFTNSSISISISSNGSFKKIQVHQQSGSDKNLEINEKEKINMGSYKIRSIDMKATDSRYVNYLKHPQSKDPYTEPILSEIYPIKSKSKMEPAQSIYWHKIVERPLKIKKNHNKNLNIFQSDGHDEVEEVDDNDDSEAEKNLSMLLKECDDFEDITDYEDIDSEEEDRKSSFRDLCKHITYLT